MSDRATITIDCDADSVHTSCDCFRPSGTMGVGMRNTRTYCIVGLLLPRIHELMNMSLDDLIILAKAVDK